jgi:hypothetical protein
MTMVEIVARAIAEKGFGRSWDDFEEVNAYDTDQCDLLAYARAAIEAMREPTEAMHEAGGRIIDEGEGYPHDKPLPTLRNAYKAMIDAALSETERT